MCPTINNVPSVTVGFFYDLQIRKLPNLSQERTNNTHRHYIMNNIEHLSLKMRRKAEDSTWPKKAPKHITDERAMLAMHSHTRLSEQKFVREKFSKPSTIYF